MWNVYRSCPDDKHFCSLDLIAGYKFLQNTESLTVQSFTTLNNALVVPIFSPGPFGVPVRDRRAESSRFRSRLAVSSPVHRRP